MSGTIQALLIEVLQASRIFVLGRHYTRLHLPEGICNRRRSSFIILFLWWILVFINDIRILLYNRLSSIIALLHVKLLFLVVQSYLVIIIWSWKCTASNRIFCSSHFALVLTWINLIILLGMHLLCRFYLCYCLITLRIFH